MRAHMRPRFHVHLRPPVVQEPFTTVPLLNPTIQCNHAWWTNPLRYGAAAPADRRADRPFLMGRFGGLGAHRYPIGFVGDTYVTWEVLRYETLFMSTASNVGFAWTHDIGGFEGPSPAEFFLRHLQFGVFSPVGVQVPRVCVCPRACVSACPRGGDDNRNPSAPSQAPRCPQLIDEDHPIYITIP